MPFDRTKVHEGYFTTREHHGLFYRVFSPSNPQKTLIILHGHGEHSGRYEKFFEHLQNEGVRIAVYDFRGHGHSEGPEVYVESFQEYLEDVSAFDTFLRDKFSAKEPLVLLGHSVGGLVAVHWSLLHPEKLAALILSSPCLGLKVPAWLVAANALMNRIHPQFVYQNPVYPPYLTHDPQEVKRYRSDLLIKRKMSVRLVTEMLSYAAKLDRMTEIRMSFPVAVLMAGVERIVDKSKTHRFFTKLQATRKELIEFPGFYHEIFNEAGQEKVFQRLKEILSRI